ncbi:MAG: acyl carrier protein [Ruminococcus flavefaciens]|nr:acyl carrier protein [Ruminococcus flavefaciens]
MSNIEQYREAFMKSLDLSSDSVNEELAYQGVDNWDSVGHMNLIAELEERFGVMMETEDIIDFSSYVKGMEILQKYGVEFQ